MSTPERTTLIETLSQEPSTSCAPERARAGALTPKWLVAQATKFMHPDKQVRVVFSKSREQEIFEVLLSGPEAESAIRQLMQAYADSIGKSLTFCAYPIMPNELRKPLTTTGDPKKEKDARKTLDIVRKLLEAP